MLGGKGGGGGGGGRGGQGKGWAGGRDVTYLTTYCSRPEIALGILREIA